MSEGAAHWNRVYGEKGSDQVSWYRTDVSASLDLLEAAGLTADSCVADVGAGDSLLVDALIDRGLHCLTVLDVSAAALERSRTRLARAGGTVRWIEADVTADDWSMDPVDLWHDRAVFHFLVVPDDRERYVQRLQRHVKPGGGVVMGTFGVNGPERCSGLPVQRYDAETLSRVLGDGFTLAESRHETHVTPWGAPQPFQWCRFTRRAAA